MTTALARAHLFYRFDAFASRNGIDFDRLLIAEGLGRKDLAEPDNEIPLNAAAQVLNNAAMECGDPCLGLHWAENYPNGASGVLGYVFPNCPTVRDAVKALARFQPLIVDPLDASFHEADGVGKLEWCFPPRFTVSRIQYVSFIMALIVLRLKKFIGPAWVPLEVQLEHRPLSCSDDVARILGPNVSYNCPANAIHFSEAVLNRTNENADLRLYELISQLGERLLAERKSQSDIAGLTRAAIVKNLQTGNVTLDTISESLKVNSRYLQSRLAASSTNFEALLQETRQSMADNYLRDSEMPMTEIAFLLGFSELSAFTRAAHRWFGMPPSDRRTGLRREAGMTA